ncbi:hypothetical protein COOONC_15653 [Cooperia oncophora]
MEDSLLQADILLWKKRSRASLRKHYSVRNLAARELYDTEKSFVEGLEFLITFAKQSMIETYISFVDNFKFAKAAITQARGKPSFEKYYNVGFPIKRRYLGWAA